MLTCQQFSSQLTFSQHKSSKNMNVVYTSSHEAWVRAHVLDELGPKKEAQNTYEMRKI